MPMACYQHAMANLQVKNVPESLQRKIRAYAKRRGRTVRDVVLEAVTREIEREGLRARPSGSRLGGAWSRRGLVTASGALCVAAARRRPAALVTADGPLARAPALGIVVHNVRAG